jgi:hypothetical protein
MSNGKRIQCYQSLEFPILVDERLTNIVARLAKGVHQYLAGYPPLYQK